MRERFRARRGMALALALAWLLAAAGCGPTGSRVLEPGTPVVLVSIDTLRSDRLPAYGYDALETPALDSLAREGVVFERVYSPYPLTLPAHASLMTGLLPTEHGVRDNLGFGLAGDRTTLAERLGQRGYRAAGFVSSTVLREQTGLGQGFDPYDDEMPPVSSRAAARLFPERSGEATIERAVAWVRAAATDAPFFLFLHLYEPHTPYEPPEPYRSRYADPYDGEIAHADALVGTLFDALRDRGLYERSLIVVLSDHGEGLGDHVESEHGLLLYREALQVPLLVRLPRGARAGERIGEPASLIDVAPTVLALLGLEREGLPGVPLLSADPPPRDRPIYGETFFGHYQYGWSPLRSVIRDALHFIEAPRPELYDLAADPGERDNLLPETAVPPEIEQALADIGEGTATPADVSPEELERLASLGYVGGFSGGTGDALGADPKDGIRKAEELAEQVRRLGRRGSTEAEQRVLELMQELEVRNEFLSRTIANNLLAAGHADSAQRVLLPFAGSADPETLQLLGQTDVALGRGDAARRRFRAILDRDPAYARAHLGLGIVALTADRRDEARNRLTRAVELDPTLAEAWNTLGALCAREGNLRCAVEQWRRAVELDPGLADAWYNLGVTLARTGDRTAAAEALRRYLPLVGGRERAEAERLLAGLAASGR